MNSNTRAAFAKNAVLLAAFLCQQAAFGANIPQAVQVLAQSYATSHPVAEPGWGGRTVQEEYAAWFFSGYVHPNGGIQTKSELMRDSYTRGQSYWRDHPDERDAILAGYGYLRVDMDGIWSRGYEKSSFVPTDLESQTWWLSSFGGARWEDLLRSGKMERNFGAAQVHITGYVSPDGAFGHLGAYRREVLVTSVRFQ